MNTSDRKLAAVFKVLIKWPLEELKRQKAGKEFRSVRDRISDEDVCKKIEFLFGDFSRPPAQRRKPPLEEALEYVHTLRDHSFIETEALLFKVWRDVIQDFNFEQVVNTAPNVGCFKAWTKAKKLSFQEIEQQLLANPVKTYATIGTDWLLERSKPQALLPLLELLLTRQSRPKYLLSWNEALVVALKKDKRGNLLTSVLRHPWPNEDRVLALSEAIRANRIVFKKTIDLLPAILTRKESNGLAVKFVGLLFDVAMTTEGVEREFITVALARLGAGILLTEHRTPNAEAALAVVQKITRQLRNLTKGQTAQSKTWVFENLCGEETPSDGKLCLNLQGARHIAVAFEKAEQGFGAKDILAVTARNLGLSTIGKNGDEATYDPLRHEDIEGGLVPGETVLIEQEGWAINEETVARAKVSKKSTDYV